MVGRAAASPTRAKSSAFAICLRTGRRTGGDLSPRAVEFKFNPYHDPRNGRFTGPGGSFGGGSASGSWRGAASTRARSGNLHNAASAGRNDSRDPANYAIHERIRQSGWREIKANGYTFTADKDDRTHLVDGDLVFGASEGRSRANQARAGGSDRRAGDDGGHYVAVRFNGPRASFNHFAQDASFNRGDYRALEDGWARKLRLGHRVHVDIFSHFTGSSKRPDSLDVYWYVDGERHHRAFPNHRKG